MRILILTQWYPPEPAVLLQELAQTLQQFGHTVEVLTGFPNYPTGTVYPGYKVRWRQREMLADVPVVRVPLFPEHSRSGVGRALNYISFAASAALFGLCLANRPDVIFVYHPPLTVGFPAWFLSRLWGVPFVYQVQDMWPETLAATGMLNNIQALRLVGAAARWIYRRADAILVISEGFRRNLLQKGVTEGKIRVIPNWADTEVYTPEAPDRALAERLGLADRFNVMFAGNLGEAQGLDTVVAAAQILREDRTLQFVLVGDGVALESLKRQVSEKQLNNVRFLGRFPTSEMSALYALADVLLVHLRNNPLFHITIPHKILAYMASGKPVLAALTGDAAAVIERAGAGVSCPPEDPNALVDGIRRLRSLSAEARAEMGRRGRLATENEYGRVRLVKQIEATLLAAAGTYA